jgi:hypothetical protein
MNEDWEGSKKGKERKKKQKNLFAFFALFASFRRCHTLDLNPINATISLSSKEKEAFL